jgi:hypothetical protein
MRRTKVTYGQLDHVLRSLGFSSRLVKGDPPAGVYEHKQTGPSFMIPPRGRRRVLEDVAGDILS